MQGKVMTVLGPIEPEALGITLTHEHLLIDLRVWCEESEDEEQKAFVHAPVEMATLAQFAANHSAIWITASWMTPPWLLRNCAGLRLPAAVAWWTVRIMAWDAHRWP